MSKESQEWLNRMCLIGYTSKRGNAWHYQASAQGDEPNHYELAIPVEDVRRRLFAWQTESHEVYTRNPSGASSLDAMELMSRSGDELRAYVLETMGFTHRDDRQATVHGGDNTLFGLFTDGYRIHQHEQWLVTNVETILDGGLAIGSAGLLRAGAVAWVQIEMADTWTHKSGVEFRPHLTACGSADGSLVTTYMTGDKLVVCDNTLNAATGDRTANKVKNKHTSGSLGRAMEIRTALDLVEQEGENLMAELDALSAEVVSNDRFTAFLNKWAPIPADEGRGKTIKENQHAAVRQLWNYDPRVAPWKGSALGVLQAVSTYDLHMGRGSSDTAKRVERNQMDFLRGKVGEADAETRKILASV